MIDPVSLSALESNLLPKYSGMVLASSACVMILVLLPRTSHARRLPINAFPIPIQVDERPYFHPNCPAYPMNTTEEKYDVPNAKADIHGPTVRPPST